MQRLGTRKQKTQGLHRKYSSRQGRQMGSHPADLQGREVTAGSRVMALGTDSTEGPGWFRTLTQWNGRQRWELTP